MGEIVVIKGLDEIRTRFTQFPQAYNRVVKTKLETLLLVIWEKVPPYPGKPAESKYTRTGTLGRTIGISEAGDKSGNPDIYKVNQHGGVYDEGRFGTALEYAPYVIGTKQASWNSHWWKLEDVPKKAQAKITSLVNKTATSMVNFLNGKGL